MTLTEKVGILYEKYKRDIKRLAIAGAVSLTIAGSSLLYLQSDHFLNMQHRYYFDTLQAQSVFFDGSLGKRSVDDVSPEEVKELHLYMQSDSFQRLSYSDQLSHVFKKAFEMKDALNYDKIEDQNDRLAKIIPAVQLAAFGFSCNGYLDFYEGHSRLTRNGKRLPENDSFEYSKTNPYEVIPSATSGPLAYDNKYHFLLSLGTILGQNNISNENLRDNERLYYLGEFFSSLNGFARGVVHSGDFRYKFDPKDVKADLAGQNFGVDLLQGKVDMNNFNISNYLN